MKLEWLFFYTDVHFREGQHTYESERGFTAACSDALRQNGNRRFRAILPGGEVLNERAIREWVAARLPK